MQELSIQPTRPVGSLNIEVQNNFPTGSEHLHFTINNPPPQLCIRIIDCRAGTLPGTRGAFELVSSSATITHSRSADADS